MVAEKPSSRITGFLLLGAITAVAYLPAIDPATAAAGSRLGWDRGFPAKPLQRLKTGDVCKVLGAACRPLVFHKVPQ